MDPEAELIFGAIKDDSLNGKMRVSIVAKKKAYQNRSNLKWDNNLTGEKK